MVIFLKRHTERAFIAGEKWSFPYIIPYERVKTMEWQELKSIEETLWDHNVEVLCTDGQVVRGAYWCHNASEVEEDDEIEIDIEQKAFFVGVPINEIVSITVLD